MPWRRLDTVAVSQNDWIGYRLVAHGPSSEHGHGVAGRIIQKVEVYGLDDGPIKGLEVSWRIPIPAPGNGYATITAKFACGSWALAVVDNGRRIILVRTGFDPFFPLPSRAPDPDVNCYEVVLEDPAH